MKQEHDQIKLFEGKHEVKKDIEALLKKVVTWVSKSNVSPKSIGITAIPGEKILMSLGYKANKKAYKVKLDLIQCRGC